jgi:hypothetical protein
VPSLAAAVRRTTPAPAPAETSARAADKGVPAATTSTVVRKQPERIVTASAAANRESEWDWSRGAPYTTTRPRTGPQAARPNPKPPETQTTIARTDAQPIEQKSVETIAAAAVETQAAPSSAVQTVSLPPASVGPGFSIASPPAASPPPVEAAEASSLPASPEPKAEPVPTGSRLADLAAIIEELPEKEVAARAAAAKRTQTAANAAKPAAAKPAAAKAAAPAAKKPAAPAEPARHWVQIAGGADKAALPREFARLKAKAPKLFAARAGWSTPLNATNRLLVGPFDSARAAQEFVNGLKEAGLTAFAWQSAAGQKIEKLGAR